MAESRERTKEMTNKQIRQNLANKHTHSRDGGEIRKIPFVSCCVL